MYVCIHKQIYTYIHIQSAYLVLILYLYGISNFRCMLRVPRGTVTKISKK